jgi:hypothetical protein
MKKLLFLIPITLLLCLNSCTDDYFEFEQIETEDWRPELALPLINSSLTLQDIIIKKDTGGFIQPNENGDTLSVVYQSKVSATPDTIVELPDQILRDSSDLIVNPNYTTITLSDTIQYKANDDIEIDSLLLREGTLILTVQSDIRANLDLTITFPGFKKPDGGSLSINKLLPASNGVPVKREEDVDLSRYLIDMTAGGQQVSALEYRVDIAANNPNPIPQSGELKFILSFTRVQLKEFYGYLGQDPIDLKQDTVDVDIFKNFITGTFFIANPELDVTIRNSFDIPTYMEFEELYARVADKNIDTLSFELPVDPATGKRKIRKLEIPSGYGVAYTNLKLRENNSNIENIISKLVREIVYDAKALPNPNGKIPGRRNFFTDTSGMELDIKLRLPLAGRSTQLTLVDTINFNMDELDNLEQGTFRMIVDNGFPVNADLNIVFIDGQNVALDSLFADGSRRVIAAASTNSQGIVTTPTREINETVLDRARILNLKGTEKAIIKAELNTPGASTGKNILFKSGYTLDVMVGLKARILIN